MDTPIRIHERGEAFVLAAGGPPKSAKAQAAVVAALLQRVGHVVRPLCVDLETGPLDPHTAFVERADRFLRIVEPMLPFGVTPTLGHARAAVQRAHLGPGVVARAIEASGGLLGRIEAAATIARVDGVQGDRVEVEGVPAGAPIVSRGPLSWLAGPLDAPSAIRTPPLTLVIEQTFEHLALTIEARWSPWLVEGAPELARLRALTSPDRD